MLTLKTSPIPCNSTRAYAVNTYRDSEFLVEIDLSAFNYRKNASHERIALDIDYYFLIELLCAISRKEGLFQEPWCRSIGCKCEDMVNLLQ